MIHQVLSKLIVDLNVGDSAVLEANYKIEDGYFISQNIKVIDDKRRYLSSLRLDLGDSHNIDVTINLQDYDVNTFNLSSYTSSSNNIIDNLFQDLVHFKSSELSAIQPKNIHLQSQKLSHRQGVGSGLQIDLDPVSAPVSQIERTQK